MSPSIKTPPPLIYSTSKAPLISFWTCLIDLRLWFLWFSDLDATPPTWNQWRNTNQRGSQLTLPVSASGIHHHSCEDTCKKDKRTNCKNRFDLKHRYLLQVSLKTQEDGRFLWHLGCCCWIHPPPPAGRYPPFHTRFHHPLSDLLLGEALIST